MIMVIVMCINESNDNNSNNDINSNEVIIA